MLKMLRLLFVCTSMIIKSESGNGKLRLLKFLIDSPGFALIMRQRDDVDN